MWERRQVELEAREEAVRERERELKVHERGLAEREATIAQERDAMAAEALRTERELRRALRAKVGHLIDKLDRLPPAGVAKILHTTNAAPG